MSVTVPNQGDPTKLSLVAAIIAEQNSLAALTYAVATLGVVSNGSFELGTPTPSGWTFTAQTAGVGAIDDTTSGHGAKSFKMTSLGGGANGGGELEMSDFVECSPQVSLMFRWQTKSSVAGVKNMVEVDWFSSPDAGDYISTTTLWSSDNNPTAWTVVGATATPPSTARYFKLRLIGCDSSDSTAGDAWFDDVVVSRWRPERKVEFRSSGRTFFTIPSDTYFIFVACVGGGGGGGPGGGVGGWGGGGGGGGYSAKFLNVTPGQVLELVIGAGGAGGTGVGSGSSGGATTVDSTTVKANGGGGGGANDSTPPGGSGASTVGAIGDITLPGGDGYIRATGPDISGTGGYSVNGGCGAYGVSSGVGATATLPGGGGSGGVDGNAGGAGASGAVIIEW